MRACRACGYEHETLMRCDVARRIRGASSQPLTVANVVVHAGGSRPAVVVHEEVPAEVNGTRHGKHLNTDARKAYRREWAKRDRAKKNAKPEFRNFAMALDFHDKS